MAQVLKVVRQRCFCGLKHYLCSSEVNQILNLRIPNLIFKKGFDGSFEVALFTLLYLLSLSLFFCRIYNGWVFVLYLEQGCQMYGGPQYNCIWCPNIMLVMCVHMSASSDQRMVVGFSLCSLLVCLDRVKGLLSGWVEFIPVPGLDNWLDSKLWTTRWQPPRPSVLGFTTQ